MFTQRCSSVMRNIEFQCRKCNIGPNFMSPTYHIHSMRTLPHSTFSGGHELFACGPLFSFTSVPFMSHPADHYPLLAGLFVRVNICPVMRGPLLLEHGPFSSSSTT